MNQQIYQKCSKKIPSLNLCLSTCFPDSNNFKLDPTSKLFQWPYFSQRPLACILSSSPILAYLEIFFCKFSWPWLFPDIGSDFFPKTTEKCKSRHLRKKVLSRVSSKLYFVIKIVLNYCEKKLFWTTVLLIEKNFEIRCWRPRIFKDFEITRTIYSNSERSEQFLVTECFFNLFLEVSHV